MNSPAPLDTATRAHHPDSPSSLQSSEACPGFLNEQRESQASADGTLQHKATETRDLSILGGNADFEWAVGKCIAYEDAVLNEFKLSGRPFRVLREVKLTVGDDAVTEGFPDTVVVGETHAVILDWKFGKEPVTPTRDNRQGIAYMLGLLRLFPELKSVQVDFFAPYQKWSEEEQQKKYRHTFLRVEADKLETILRVIIAKKHAAAIDIDQHNNWSACTPKHGLCLWCARKSKCTKLGALIIATNEKYSDLVVPDEMKEWKLATRSQIADAYRFVNQMTLICEAVKRRCIDAAVTEDLLPDNFTIVRSQHRKVKSVSAFLSVAEELGIPRDTSIELLSVSFKPFEDLLKKSAARGQGATKLREFNTALEEGGVTTLGTPFYFLREVKSPADKSPVIDI
jgi:hypothetical protein